MLLKPEATQTPLQIPGLSNRSQKLPGFMNIPKAENIFHALLALVSHT
jgi:hypothetical protein